MSVYYHSGDCQVFEIITQLEIECHDRNVLVGYVKEIINNAYYENNAIFCKS